MLEDGISVYDVEGPHEEDVETPSSFCGCCLSMVAPNRLTFPCLEVSRDDLKTERLSYYLAGCPDDDPPLVSEDSVRSG